MVPRHRRFKAGHLPDTGKGKSYFNLTLFREACQLFNEPAHVIVYIGEYGTTGLLQRRHIQIDNASIHYIGKESNELDETQIIGVDGNNYTEYKNTEALIHKLLSYTAKEALKLGISKMHYYRLLKNYKEGKPIKLNKKTMKKIAGYQV